MVDISNVPGYGSTPGGSEVIGNMNNAYREADFMAIMLAEITQQDPMEPADTHELVRGMQQLQDLANSQYEKYRADIDWAQNLMGQTVVVSQVNLTESEHQAMLERGLNPDRGFGHVNGPVDFFRSIGEQVWVRVGEHDYPIDNIQSVAPEPLEEGYFTGMADHLLGRDVTWIDEEGQLQHGQVDRISWDEYGAVRIHIGDTILPFEAINSIGGGP